MATQINFFYQQYVTTMMTIDEDANGLFCNIPSESNGESYEVRCTEHADHVEVESCQCQGFHYRKSCKHVIIVQNWYNKIYASSIAKASEKALEQAIDASDSLEEVEEMVAFSEQVLAATKRSDTFYSSPAPVATPSVTFAELIEQEDQMSLIVPRKIDGHSVRTASFFGSLPSRQKSKVA
jgi:hypothetical protein